MFTKPEDASRALASSLARPADAGPTPRGTAIALFRRHLARIQQGVRDEFEQHRLDGERAAQTLAGLTDGLIAALHDLTLNDALQDEVA
ncbi:MAG: hypothetical protein ACRYGI_07010, partial [Janthinobacterium lividum]